jgi:hypothetical protein
MVKFEVNKSFDYNDSFPAKLDKRDPRYSGDNGQPSVIYDGRLKIGGGPATVELQAVGTGAANGQDGKIHDLKGITTALRIIDKIEVSYQ